MTRTRSRAAAGALVAALLLAAACTKPASPPAGKDVKRYTLRGEVMRVDAAAKTATIQHEKIDGWMEAMTMDFPVKDDAEFKKLAVGARITATVVVEGFEYHLVDIRPAQP